MPQERDHQYPHVTPEEWAKIREEHDPADTAARSIACRHITGIPARGFLIGDNDHSPVMRGVREFTAAVLDLLAVFDAEGRPGAVEAERRVREIMENPGGL